jgi:hypothetical protein
MSLTRKDVLATGLTLLAVLSFAAANEGWDVWLVGSSYRWAAVVVTLVGVAACALGSAGDEMAKGAKMDRATMALSGIGALSTVFAVWAIVAGSRTSLALLVVSIVVLWLGATVRHVAHGSRGPIAT